MPDPLTQIRERAGRSLAAGDGEPPRNRDEWLACYKSFLDDERRRFREAHEAGESGLAVARLRSEVLDVVFGTRR